MDIILSVLIGIVLFYVFLFLFLIVFGGIPDLWERFVHPERFKEERPIILP